MACVEVIEVRDAADRESAFAIRRQVFIDEQAVPAAAEFDEHDTTAVHLLARDGGRPVGTLRIRVPADRTVKIERVAVVADRRGTGVGRALLLAALDQARMRGAREARLHAQVQAQDFYARLGFRTVGGPFMEDGIRHVAMVRQIADAAAEDAA